MKVVIRGNFWIIGWIWIYFYYLKDNINCENFVLVGIELGEFFCFNFCRFKYKLVSGRMYILSFYNIGKVLVKCK